MNPLNETAQLGRSIVLIDDDFAIREVLKAYINSDNTKILHHNSFYTSENGVEGLGYILVSKPDIIIIDSTLPKYSGRELLDYLFTNKYVLSKVKKIIILVDDGKRMDLPGNNFVVLDKSNPQFLNRLTKVINPKTITSSAIKFKICANAIKWANKKDLLLQKISQTKSKPKRYSLTPLWFFSEVITSVYFSFLRLFSARVSDANLKQEKKDLLEFRVRTYPTLTTVFVSLIFLLLQFTLFVTGGLVIFNVRVQSVFAMGGDEKGYEFNSENDGKYKYDKDRIEFTNSGVSLKGSKVETPVVPEPVTPEPEVPVTPEPAAPETPSEVPTPTETPTTPVTPEPTTPTEPEVPTTPTEPTVPETPTTPTDNQTQGKLNGALNKALAADESTTDNTTSTGSDTTTNTANETVQSSSTSSVTYPTDSPVIETKDSTKYTNLTQILERSSINTDESSVSTSEDYTKAHKDALTNIKYQLSPDSDNWYYYNIDDKKWTRTTQDSVSSNTIQEVNENLDTYKENFSSGELFFKIYLISTNGKETPTLRELVVERENSMIITEETTLPEEPTVPTETISSMDFTKLEVAIFNASFYNGNKVVRGKVLLKDHKVKGKYQISDEDLSKFDVNIYYSRHPNATQGDLIGTTTLYKNSQGEIEFTLIKASTSGGYVTAEVVAKQDPNVTTEPAHSELAKPIENSTFTVDSTGDEADATLDGLCSTSGGKCTLRAAITEANSVAGSDNIYFNIPTSDTGYRDYDLPDTASSGDSSGGDDYWTIRPATALPNITGETHIDGSTQITNQGDTNTSGPEVELYDGGMGNGYVITISGSNTTINSLSFNEFYNYFSIPSGTNMTFTNNYIGCDVKCLMPNTLSYNYQGFFLSAGVTNIQIGTVGNGNKFKSFYRGIVDLAQDTNITSNTISTTYRPIYTELRANILNNEIYNSRSPLAVIGGTAVIKGNYIHDNHEGILNISKNQNKRTATTDDVLSSPTIGGQNSLSGSLCNGLEQNCIENNGAYGINSIDTIPANETTLFQDNDFGDGNGSYSSDFEGNINIRQDWVGLFEIFSNNSRRTDLTNLSIENPTLFQSYFSIFLQIVYNSSGSYDRQNIRYLSSSQNCLDGATYCPDQGIANSSGKTSILSGFEPNYNMTADIQYSILGLALPWRLVPEYIIDNTGTKVYQNKIFHFDDSHFASQQFSFDGNSTTDPVITASSRSVTANGVTQTYYDRGEPWTDKPNATRNIATGDIGRFQLMEVELVDANPVLQEDGSYIITVDSTGDEDNVSLAGYDDGGGAYSGGGSNGVSGLANGKTSLREATIVASNFNAGTAQVKIQFDIPTSDSGWNTSSFPNAFVITPTLSGNGYAILKDNVTIDGSTQTLITGDTNQSYTEPTEMPLTGNATTGPEIIIDGSQVGGSNRLFAITGRKNLTFNSIGFYNKNNSRAVIYSGGSGTENIDIVNCTFVNNGSRAIEFRSGYVTDANISNNVFRNNNLSDASSYTYPVVSMDMKNGEISSNVFAGNGINPIDVRVDPTSTEITITDNLIKANLNAATSTVGSSINIATNTGGKLVNIEDNTFIANSGFGVKASDASSHSTFIKNNVFKDNSNIAINLSGGTEDSYKITANDTGDVDTGANNLMNYPTIDTAAYMGTGIYHIAGTLDGKASEGPWTIEICESDRHDSAHGDCLRSLATITTDASGNWSTDITISGDDGSQGRVFSATATNNTDDTSEFSVYAISTNTIYPITATYAINNQQTSNRRPFFDWSANGDPDIDHYELWFGSDQNDLPKVVDNIDKSVTNYTLTDLQNYGTYYWKVLDIRANGTTGGESGVQTFQIIEKLTPLSLIYPTGGIQIDELKPMFSWAESASDNTDYYQVFVKKLDKNEQPNEGTLVTDANRLAVVNGKENTTFTSTKELSYGNYAWIVFSNYSDGKREGKSEIGAFEIIKEVVNPVIPVLPATDSNNTKGSTDTKTKIADAAKTITMALAILSAAYALVATIVIATSSTPLSGLARILSSLFIGFVLPRKNKSHVGSVLDASNNNQPIPFAIIKLYKANKLYSKTYSDANGAYNFSKQINSEIKNLTNFTIEASAPGYQNKKQKAFNFYLEKSQTKLNILEQIIFYKKLIIIRTLKFSLIALFGLVFLYSFLAAIVNPSFVNIAVLSLYLIVVLSTLILNKLVSRK